MKRSVPAKLFAGFTIASLGIVLLIAWFAVYVTSDRLASRERAALAAVGSALSKSAQEAALLALSPSSEGYDELVRSHRRLLAAIEQLPLQPRMMFRRPSLVDQYTEFRQWSKSRLTPLPEIWDTPGPASADFLSSYLNLSRQLGVRLEGYLAASETYRGRLSLGFTLLLSIMGALLLVAICVYAFFTLPDLGRDFQVLMSFSRSIVAGTAQSEPSLSRERDDEIAELFEQLLRVYQLKRSLGQVQGVVFELAHRLQEVGSQSGQAYGSVSKQADLLESSTAGFTGISASIRAVAENARFNSETVESSGSEIRSIFRGIEEAGGSMRELSAKINRVEEITALIQDIADQTDLLALNASIEAARAGESGQGFNVVASEVQKLAQRSSKAATEVADLVRAIQAALGQLTRNYGEAQVAMGSIQRAFGHIAEAAAQVVLNSDKAAGAISRTSESLDNITNLTIEGLNNAAEVVKAYQDLQGSADKLQALMGGLQEYWKPIAYKGLQVSLQEAKPMEVSELR
jgi:methyl-accepting chemotaxis protein